MIDLDTVDPELIKARGQYATCNAAFKDLKEEMTAKAERACYVLRHGLNEDDRIKASEFFGEAAKLSSDLIDMAIEASSLKVQVETLKLFAWGHK